MSDSSTALSPVLQFRQDLQTKLRDGVRRAIETVLEEELLAALGAAAHERISGRRGYRHGTIERTMTTRDGTRAITVPRARLRDQDGPPTEFRSTVLPRYARRTREVDEALLGCYFGGVNSRRIRRALRPLLGEAPLSKSAVSRVVTRVKDQFAVWQQRPLTDERYGVVFLDGFHLRVRLAGRVVMVPVLAALGVTDTGQKRLLAMQLAASEAAASWGGLLAKLQQRGLPAPLLVGEQATPRCRGFSRGQVQRHELFLAGGRDAERRQDRHDHHAAGEPDPQMDPVQEHHRVALVGQGPLLPHRELLLHPRHHARDGALRQRRRSQERLERSADAAAIDPAEIAAEERVVDLAGPSRIARQYRALKLRERPRRLPEAGAGHREGSRPLARRHRPVDSTVSIPTPTGRAFVRIGPERGEQLLLEDGLDGATHAGA